MNITTLKENIYSKRKKLIFLLCLFLFAFLFMTLPAFSFAKDSMQNTCKTMIAEIFNGGLSESVKEIILTNPALAYPDAWSVIENVYKSGILPIAFGLLTVHLIIGVIQQSIRLDQLTWQQLIKPFLSFFAAWFVMKNGLNILLILIQISQEIVEHMGSASSSSMESLLDAANAIVEREVDGIITGFFFMFQILLPYAAALILNLAIRVVCYTRIFELYLKTMIAPLGMGDIVTKGVDGNGMRFFKNYFATCLQGAIIIGVSIIYGAVLGSILPGVDASAETTIAGLAGTALVMGFAALSMMFKAGQITKEVLGA